MPIGVAFPLIGRISGSRICGLIQIKAKLCLALDFYTHIRGEDLGEMIVFHIDTHVHNDSNYFN